MYHPLAVMLRENLMLLIVGPVTKARRGQCQRARRIREIRQGEIARATNLAIGNDVELMQGAWNQESLCGGPTKKSLRPNNLTFSIGGQISFDVVSFTALDPTRQ